MSEEKKKKEKVDIPIEKKYPSVILGLDISTACIGISIVYDDGENEPEIIKLTHIVPKIDKNIKGIEALILRKKIFEDEFLRNIGEEVRVTECVIESPLMFATGNSNAQTVSQLILFNGLLSEAIYDKLGIVPYYFTSYDARMYSFPELLTIRKYNKKGEPYPLKHIKKAIGENNLTLFGSYPFDCDKKNIMMNMVTEKYTDINWIYNKKNELKKENYDACDSLVCALAYVNKKKYGPMEPKITEVVEKTIDKDNTEIDYTVTIWEGMEAKRKKIMVDTSKKSTDK